MQIKLQTTLVLLAVFMLVGAGSLALAQERAAGQPDFNRALLEKAAADFNDPDDIAAIPDEVVIEDFINIAFSDHVWLYECPEYARGACLGRLENPPDVPGEQELLVQQKRITKFMDPPMVFSPQGFENSSVFLNHLKLVMPDLLQITDVPSPDTYYRRGTIITIVNDAGDPLGDFWPAHTFKLNYRPPYVRGENDQLVPRDPRDRQNVVPKNAIRFTPELEAQAEGHFTRDDKYSIKGAKCYFWEGYSEEAARALTTECLLRSLGLPDQSFVFDNTVLGNWNKVMEDKVLPHLALNLSDHYRHWKYILPYQVPGSIDQNGQLSGIGFWVGSEALDWMLDKSAFLYEYTDYDRLILRVLYDDRIKPGMTPEEIRDVLPEVIPDARKWITENPALEIDRGLRASQQEVELAVDDVASVREEQLAEDFVKIMTSSNRWKEDYWPHHEVAAWERKQAKKSGNPKGASQPSPSVEIHKWVQPIRIGFIMPRIRNNGVRLEPNPAQPSPKTKTKWLADEWINIYRNEYSHAHVYNIPYVKKIEVQAQKLAPKVAELTGLPVDVMTFDDFENTDKHAIANISIYPVFLPSSNLFREPLSAAGIGYGFKMPNDERRFPNAIRFTRNEKSQVEGYLLLDRYGNINNAVCKIWWNHSEAMVRALVTECLVRALGLHNVSGLVNDAVVSDWNRAHDKYGRIPAKGWDWTDFEPEQIDISDVAKWRDAVDARTDHSMLRDSFSPYDELMVRALYDSRIKSRMTQEQAGQILPGVFKELRSH